MSIERDRVLLVNAKDLQKQTYKSNKELRLEGAGTLFSDWLHWKCCCSEEEAATARLFVLRNTATQDGALLKEREERKDLLLTSSYGMTGVNPVCPKAYFILLLRGGKGLSSSCVHISNIQSREKRAPKTRSETFNLS